MTDRFQILVVEDSETMQGTLDTLLSPIAELTPCKTISDARVQILRKNFDMLLLDLQLPDGDGLEFFRDLSAAAEEAIPTLVVSGDESVARKVGAFSQGAWDYIVKPFDPEELKARVGSHMLRARNWKVPKQVTSFKFGDLTLDPASQTVRRDGAGADASLTSLEFRIINFLVRHADAPVPRERLLAEIWGENVHVTPRTVATHMSNLRMKLQGSLVRIQYERGLGYQISCTPVEPGLPIAARPWKNSRQGFVDLFLSLSESTRARVEKCFAERDLKGTLGEMHKIKSSAGQVGAEGLRRLCDGLERELPSAPVSEWRRYEKEFRKVWTQSLEMLRQSQNDPRTLSTGVP